MLRLSDDTNVQVLDGVTMLFSNMYAGPAAAAMTPFSRVKDDLYKKEDDILPCKRLLQHSSSDNSEILDWGKGY